jgi:hypothetical protein
MWNALGSEGLFNTSTTPEPDEDSMQKQRRREADQCGREGHQMEINGKVRIPQSRRNDTQTIRKVRLEGLQTSKAIIHTRELGARKARSRTRSETSEEPELRNMTRRECLDSLKSSGTGRYG